MICVEIDVFSREKSKATRFWRREDAISDDMLRDLLDAIDIDNDGSISPLEFEMYAHLTHT